MTFLAPVKRLCVVRPKLATEKPKFQGMCMKKILLALAVAVALTACRQPVPIQDHEEIAIVRYDNETLSLEQVQRAILLAGIDQGWDMRPAGKGHVVGTLLVRGKHTAVVDIEYDAKAYSVLYKDSTNLDFRQPRLIHPNYNAWVSTLIRHINSSLQRVE